MKQLIVLAAILPLMLGVIGQFPNQMRIANQMQKSSNAVINATDLIKQKGNIEDDDSIKIKAKIANIVGCSSADISVEFLLVSSRGSDINIYSYTVKYPIKKLIVYEKLFMIREENNYKYCTLAGEIVL